MQKPVKRLVSLGKVKQGVDNPVIIEAHDNIYSHKFELQANESYVNDSGQLAYGKRGIGVEINRAEEWMFSMLSVYCEAIGKTRIEVLRDWTDVILKEEAGLG